MKRKISEKMWVVLAAVGTLALFAIGCGGGAKKVGVNETKPVPQLLWTDRLNSPSCRLAKPRNSARDYGH
jgi:hypothetical protein